VSRTLSFSGTALTELLMNPPVKNNGGDARFRGRDWRTIQVQEIIDPTETRFVELDTSIEDTTKLLVRSGAPNVVLIRESRKTRTAIGLFGYDELNAYLLLVLGWRHPDEHGDKIVERARGGETLALREVNEHLGSREDPIFLSQTANLSEAMEMLGGGLHRVVVCKDGTSEAIGILTQLRLVRFFWENHQNFATTEQLYSLTLKDLDVGAKEVLAINGDRPLSDALRLMHDEGITSLPVLDTHNNVVGNISHVDTRVSASTPCLASFMCTILKYLTALNGHLGNPSPIILLHPLHLRHPLRTRSHGRSRFLPRLLRNPLQHISPHSRKTLRNALPSNVDRRRTLTIHKRATESRHRASRIAIQHAKPERTFLSSTRPGRIWE
jgi:CBS domain-containing protein